MKWNHILIVLGFLALVTVFLSPPFAFPEEYVNVEFQGEGEYHYKTVTMCIPDIENTTKDASRGTQSKGMWCNTSGKTFVIDSMNAICDADSVQVTLSKSASLTDIASDSGVTIIQLSIFLDGTGGYYTSAASGFLTPSIENNKWLFFTYDAGSAESTSIHIKGYLQ